MLNIHDIQLQIETAERDMDKDGYELRDPAPYIASWAETCTSVEDARDEAA